MRTCRLSRSSSVYTATVAMPSSWQARTMRMAISPRLAMSIFWNMEAGSFRAAALPVSGKNAASFYHLLACSACRPRRLHRADMETPL
ncbi:hypothetical protein D3C72_1021210 [compost metagenome]